MAYYTAAYVDVPEEVYPGMQAIISIPQSEAQDVVVLKLDATSFVETNQAYVLVQNADGAMEKVSITTGMNKGNCVEITFVLRNGDTVYVETAAKDGSNMFDSLFSIGGGGQTNRQTDRQNNNERTMPNNMNRNNTRQTNGDGQGGDR